MHFLLINPTEYRNFCLIPNQRRQTFELNVYTINFTQDFILLITQDRTLHQRICDTTRKSHWPVLRNDKFCHVASANFGYGSSSLTVQIHGAESLPRN
jgi:hypothetical protein